MLPARRLGAACLRGHGVARRLRFPSLVGRAAASGTPGDAAIPQAHKAPGGGPAQLVTASGAPLTSGAGGGATDPALGPEVEITAQNAAQLLQNPGAILLQVGELDEAVTKKINRLRLAASGRIPLLKLDCAKLPQVCKALQISSTPVVLLMAKGRVAAALEGDLSPKAATAFLESCAQMMQLKVDLAENISEQLTSAETLEWTDPTAAEQAFGSIAGAEDAPVAARVRAEAGRARCAVRLGKSADAEALLARLDAAGHGRAPEVRQATALIGLAARRPVTSSAQLEEHRAAAEAAPKDVDAVESYALALLWAGQEKEAFEVGVALLRRGKNEAVRKLVKAIIEAMGPHHPHAPKARRAFSSALFV